MTAYVVDASVALKWYVPEVHAENALRVLEPGNELHVPDLFHAEVGNILWKKSRRGELSSGEARRIARAVLAIPLTVHRTASLLEGALDIATRAGCTVYDGLYLALAVTRGVRLVTADRRLVKVLEALPLSRHILWIEDVPEHGRA